MKNRRRIETRLHNYEKQYRQLARQLANIGFVWEGTITYQMLTCGRKTCGCHRKKSKRHGPYPNWTTKVRGKTVSRRLTREEASLYEEWIENRRNLDKIKKEMLALSKKIAPLVVERRIASSLPSPPSFE